MDSTASAKSRVADASLSWNKYVSMVLQHGVAVMRILKQHAGSVLGERVPGELSVERRFAALNMILIALNQTLIPLFFKPSPLHTQVLEALSAELASEVAIRSAMRDLLPPDLICPTLEALCEGWDKTRNAAAQLLWIYSEYAPSELFGDQKRSPSDLKEDGWNLIRAKPFRLAEGGVHMVVLALYGTSEARKMMIDTPDVASAYRFAQIDAIQETIENMCHQMSELNGMEAFEKLFENPFHGLLSLSAALFEGAHKCTSDAVSLTKATERALSCCVAVLHVCSRLVSECEGDASAPTGSSPSVDCRGHVYRKEIEGSGGVHEYFARTVVNNSWLGVRVATSTIEHCLGFSDRIESISLDLLKHASGALMDALLRTKHNGVMSKCRQALQYIASMMLKARDDAYRQFPRELLGALLGERGVASTSESRILRRSQGLPHAILALLEAEDSSAPLSLFPQTMNQLLLVARGDCDAHKVNALNVLKFVFDDHVFASRVVPFVQEAFLIASSGFRHSNWAVRNSSLMLFSSVLHRLIGDHPSHGGHGVNTSLQDISLRMPLGVRLIRKELEQAIEETKHSNIVQPSLFPILLMLSMLCPEAPHQNGHALKHATDDDTEAMIAITSECRCLRNLVIRAAGAGALASLIPVQSLSKVIAGTATALGEAESLNTIHGGLLQLHRIVGKYCGSIDEDVKAIRSGHFTEATAQSVLRETILTLTRFRENIKERVVGCPTTVGSLLALVADVLYSYVEYFVDDNVPLFEHICAIATICSEIGTQQCASLAEGSVATANFTSSQRSLAIYVVAVVRWERAVRFRRNTALLEDALEEIRECFGGQLRKLLNEDLRNERNAIPWVAYHLCRLGLRDLLQPINECLGLSLSGVMRDLAISLLDAEHNNQWSIARSRKIGIALRFMHFARDTGAIEQGLMCSGCYSMLRWEQFYADGGKNFIPFGEARAWAVRCLGLIAASSGTALTALASLSRRFSSPEMPVVCRLAAANAVFDAVLDANEPDTKHVDLAFTLFTLLFDDDESVRHAACQSASLWILRPTLGLATPKFVLCQVSCILGLVQWLRRHGPIDSTFKERLDSVLIDSVKTEGEDDLTNAADVLFEAESDNMYVERAVMNFWAGAASHAHSQETFGFEVLLTEPTVWVFGALH
jgi:hypothetical protein